MSEERNCRILPPPVVAVICAVFSLVAASLLWPRYASGQEALSLDEAVAVALARHPDVLAAAQGVKAAAARRLQAEARPEPVLSMTTESIPWTFKARGGQPTEFSLGIEQTFEFPGKRTLRSEVGRFAENIAALELDRARLVVAARVKRAYYRAVLAERTVSVLEPTVEILDRFIESIQVRYQSGGAAYGDVLRARVEKARLRNRLIEERRERAAARADLFFLLGRPSGDAVRLVSGLVYVPLEKTAAEVLAMTKAMRPSIKIASLKEEQAAVSVNLAALNRKPDLSAGLFVPNKNLGGWGFTLGLSLPISERRRAGELAEAEAARETNRIAAVALEQRLAALVNQAYAGVRAAEEQILVFEQALLGEIQDELKISLSLYEYGKMEAYALLDLERSTTEAKLEHLRALYLYALAVADLDVVGEDGA